MEKWTRLLIITATSLLLLTFVGVAIHLGTFIQHTLLLFSLGALLAYALDPLVEALRRLKIGRSKRETSREASVASVFFIMIVVIGLAVWSLSGHLVKQVTALQTGLPHDRERALLLAHRADVTMQSHGIHYSIEDLLQHPPSDATTIETSVAKQALPFLTHLFKDLGEGVIVLLITVYFLLFATDMRQKFNALLPENVRPRADLWETDVNRILGGFVRGQLIIALLLGAAAAIVCLAIGIHIWLIIGLFVVVAALIPVFGPYLGAVPAIIAALVSPTHFSPVVSAILVAVLFIGINEIGSKVLYPKLVGKALGLHTVLVLFVLFAGLEVSGIVGVLFAAPLTALVIVSVVHLYRFWQDLPDDLLSNIAREDAGKKPLPAPTTATDSAGLGQDHAASVK